MVRGRFVRHPGGDTGDRSVGLRNNDQISPAIGVLPEDEHRLAASTMKRIVDSSLDRVVAGSMCLFRAGPDHADVDAAFQQMGGEAMAQDMHAHALGETRRLDRRTTGRVQAGRLDRLVRHPARKQKHRRPRQPSIAAQNGKQRPGQHPVSLFAALAALDPHDHAAAADVSNLEADDLGNPQPRGIGRRQGDAGLQAGNRLQKPHDLIRAQHHRQLARLAGLDDSLRDRVLAQRHAVKEPQGANDLIERGPRDPLRCQMNLVRAHVLQTEPVGRATKILAEP